MTSDRGLSLFFVGLGIGVAAGVLFAPNSGPETRDLLAEKANEGKDYIRRRQEELAGQAEELLDRGKSAVQRQKDTLGAAVSAGKSAYRESVHGSPTPHPSPVAGPGMEG